MIMISKNVTGIYMQVAYASTATYARVGESPPAVGFSPAAVGFSPVGHSPVG